MKFRSTRLKVTGGFSLLSPCNRGSLLVCKPIPCVYKRVRKLHARTRINGIRLGRVKITNNRFQNGVAALLTISAQQHGWNSEAYRYWNHFLSFYYFFFFASFFTLCLFSPPPILAFLLSSLLYLYISFLLCLSVHTYSTLFNLPFKTWQFTVAVTIHFKSMFLKFF